MSIRIPRILLRSFCNNTKGVYAQKLFFEEGNLTNSLKVDLDETRQQTNVHEELENAAKKRHNRTPLQPVQDRSVILEGLPSEYSFYHLKKLMRQYGFVIRTNVVQYKNTHTGLVEFPTPAIAQDAVAKFSSIKLDGKLIKAKIESKSELFPTLREYICDCSISVSFLPFNLTVREIREYFEQVGPITGTQIARDMFGQCKDRGFIYYQNPKIAKKAIETFHDKEFHGRKLVVRKYNID